MLEGAVALCGDMARNEHGPGRWLSYLGTSGNGKTHLAMEILRWAQENMRATQGLNGVAATRPMAFVTAHDLAARCRGGEWEWFGWLQGCWLLVLDELGAPRDPTGFVVDLYGRLLNKRLGRWTVITSNFLPQEIARSMDARIASRLYRDGSSVIECTAQDYWLRKDAFR